jgi:agmatinase
MMSYSISSSDKILKHVGIRGAISSWEDYEDDAKVGFVISHAEDIEEVGWRGIVKRIREVVGENPVYST